LNVPGKRERERERVIVGTKIKKIRYSKNLQLNLKI